MNQRAKNIQLTSLKAVFKMLSLNSSKWFQLNNPSTECNAIYMTSINQHEFIIATQSENSIERFNINTNQWTKINCNVVYSEDEYRDLLSFCPRSQRLFVVRGNSYESKSKPNLPLRTLDIRSGKYIATQMKSHGLDMTFCNIHIDGRLHLIGGEPPLHLEYNDDYQSFETIFDFRNDGAIITRIYRSTAVYVPSKQMIVLIGGYDRFPTKFVGVWIYSLVKRKWRKLCIEFDIFGAEAVLTSDEQNIIIVGGQCAMNDGSQSSTNIDSIYVLGITDFDKAREFTLKKSLISLPQKRQEFNKHDINSVITGGYKGEILVTGYVKLMFRMENFKELRLPSVSIIQIIERYLNIETLHWICHINNEDKHFAIHTGELLSNLETDIIL